MAASRGVRLWIVSLLLLAACFLTYRPWKGFRAREGVLVVSEPLRIADNLYRSGEFANPFAALPTGYTAHTAPGYPMLLCGVLKLFEEGAGGWLAVRCLPVLSLGLQIALLPWFSRIFGYSPLDGHLGFLYCSADKARGLRTMGST